MDDVVTVRVIECTSDLVRNTYRVRDGQLALGVETITQRLSVHHRHHVVQRAVRFAGVEQRQDMRVTQLRGELYFAQKPLATE